MYRRLLSWALFILCVLLSASATATAATHFLGGVPAALATPLPTPDQSHLLARECASQADADSCYRALATTVVMSARIEAPGTPLPCPGYDPHLPAPDSCPPGTPAAVQR
jgi:hypothetical protein